MTAILDAPRPTASPTSALSATTTRHPGMQPMALGAQRRDTRRTPDLAHDSETLDQDPFFARQRTSSSDLPDPRMWAHHLARLLIESLDGRRPTAQLARHVEPEILSRISRHYRSAQRRGRAAGPTGIRRVRVCQPCDGVAEVAVVARISGRPVPIALRLNGLDGRWRVTVLEMI